MSIHKRRDTGKFEVRWRDEHDTQRARSFTLRGDAQSFEDNLRRRLQLGPVLARELDRRPLTLRQFVHAGFRTHAVTLARATRAQYAWALEHHLTEIADLPLVMIDVPTLAEHQAFLLEEGRTPNTVRDVMTRLSGVLQVAVEHSLIPANPVRGLRKVPAEPREEVQPLSPEELEAVIRAFTGRSRAITVLAGYFGLRPLEIRLVPCRALDSDQLTISRARTKRTAARSRVLTGPHAGVHELKQWLLESGLRGDAPIIGGETKSTLVQWTWKTFAPTVLEVTGRKGVTLYTLRHTHASMLHYCEDYTLPRILKRLGHSAAVHFEHYAHIIDAAEGRPAYPDLDALITAAREPRVRSVFAKI